VAVIAEGVDGRRPVMTAGLGWMGIMMLADIADVLVAFQQRCGSLWAADRHWGSMLLP
jgi:hypothetical protein